MTPILPVDYWRNENDFPATREKKKPYQYVSVDHSVFIPAGEDFVTGSLYYGSKIHDVLLAFGLAPAPTNRRLYITDENQENTFSAAVGDDGSFTDVKLFAEIGGESVAEDVEGNVYIAAGQIFVYNPSGERIGTIEVPERPSQILFGGADRKTLFIAARSSLYAVQMRNAGR
jgi:sugar lactone lactonase YvrE